MKNTPFQKALQNEIQRINELQASFEQSPRGFFSYNLFPKRYTVGRQATPKKTPNFFSMSLRFLSLFFF